MKKYLLVALAFTAAAIVHADAQSFAAPVNNHKAEQAQRAPAPVYHGKSVGAFPRAFAAGNPIQLINPRAPQRYRGTPEETVVAQASSPDPQHNRGESDNRYAGVILFGLRW